MPRDDVERLGKGKLETTETRYILDLKSYRIVGASAKRGDSKNVGWCRGVRCSISSMRRRLIVYDEVVNGMAKGKNTHLSRQVPES